MQHDISAPEWLSRTGKYLWRKLAQELKDHDNLTATTAETLALLVQSYEDYREMTQVLAKEGRIITSGSGIQKPHPAAACQKTAAELFCRLAGELKLTPKSKATGKTATPDDELETFLGERV